MAARSRRNPRSRCRPRRRTRSLPRRNPRSRCLAAAAKPPVVANPGASVAGADPDLASADADLAANRLVEALDGLLRAWARRRSSEVAGLIDRLGAVIARSLSPIAGNKNTIDGAWRDVGDQLRPADVPRLVVALDLGSAPQAVRVGSISCCGFRSIRGWPTRAMIDMSLKFVSSSAGPAAHARSRSSPK